MASPGDGTTTLGGGTAISGGGTPDTGCGTPFWPVPAEFNHWLWPVITIIVIITPVFLLLSCCFFV